MDGKEKIRLIETMDYFPAKGKNIINSLFKAKNCFYSINYEREPKY